MPNETTTILRQTASTIINLNFFSPPKKNGSFSVAYQPSQYRTLDDAGGAGGLGTLDSRGVSRASLSRLDAWHGWQRRMDTFLV